MDTIITFQSVHHALKCEDVLLQNSLKLSLITTPRSVTSRCGFSVEISDMAYKIVKEYLVNSNLKYDALYEKSIEDGIKYYAKKD